MFEIIRWISLAMLWMCIGVNLWCIIRSSRSCAELDKARENLERGLAEVEELRNKYLERLGIICDNIDSP
jgi:hypothetical protein